MRIFLDLFSVAIHKDSGISKASTEEYFKLVPHGWDKAVFVLFLLIFLLTKADLILKKRCSKENLVSAFGSSVSKVILVFMTEVITFHIGFIAVYIHRVGFEQHVLRLLRGDGSLSLQNGHENLLKVFLHIFGGNKKIYL